VRTRRPQRADWADYLSRAMVMIDRHGHLIQAVSDPKQHAHPFLYTVGLAPRGYEFVMVGLPVEVAHGILNSLVALDAEEPVVDDFPFTDLLEPPFRAVVEPMESTVGLDIAEALYDSSTWRARQVLWPDQAGLLPTEDGCDQLYVDLQRSPRLAAWARP